MELSSTLKSWLVNNVERLSACLTWLFVSVSALYFLTMQLTFWHWRPIAALALFISIAICFVLVTRHDESLPRWRYFLLWAMYALSVASQLLLPYAYIAIFVVIWSAVLPYYLSWGKCLVLCIPLALPTVFIQEVVWEENQALLTGALFWTFNLFAMMMSNTAIKETAAREEADALNRQLISTQHLMKQAITQDERLRIARNIHDVVGHHLTALTINLQVASRKSKLAGNDEVKAQVDQCHAIAKLLLSDVREAVSDIRENAAIDFNGALQSLISDLPRPQVQLDIQPDFILSNVKIADALLRIIQEGLTNVIRHTQSHRFNIALSKHDNVYILVMQDVQLNVEKPITQGNGLIGMRERVSALGGELQTGFNAQGFYICATLVEAE
ncbi:MAG: histidine kinase [Pseudomonadota bacterium]|nr:histidine kinase [Pseudomonadota bacterium]